MPEQQRVLILFAHPSLHRSEVNRYLYQASNNREGATLIDLYYEYPTFQIDIEAEQQRLRDHDVIVFMFPLYWYSTPSILKEWQDLVLEYGFAYGPDGKALHGKHFVCVLSAGGPEKAYHSDGYNHFTIRELLQPLEQTAALTGMHYLPPFTLFGSRTASDEGRIGAHIEQWETLLQLLIEGRVPAEQLSDALTLNDFVASQQEGAQ